MRIPPILWVLLALVSGILLSGISLLQSVNAYTWVMIALGCTVLILIAKTKIAGIFLSFLLLAAYFNTSRLIDRANLLHSLPFFSTGYYKLELHEIKGRSGTRGRRLIFTTTSDERSYKVQTYLDDDSLLPGDVLWVYGVMTPIKGPTSLVQFNFKAYAHRHGILADIKIHSWEKKKLTSPTLLQRIKALPYKVHQKLIDQGISDRQAGLLMALLFGNRSELDSNLRSSYQDVGLAHIMAISGLHLGIIFAILLLLTSFFRPKTALFLRLLGLLSYCIMVGAAPSVLRAGLMAAFIAVGIYRNQKGSLINSLLASAVLLLLIDGSLLYETGFQLSYLAVLSIITFLPLLQKLYQPNNRILVYIRDLFMLSLAVQLGTFPLVIHLFDKFSILFLPGNLLLIPFMGILLISGYLLSTAALFDLDLSRVYTYFDSSLAWINDTIIEMSNYRSFIWTDFNLSAQTAILLTLCIFNLGFFLYHRKKHTATLIFAIIVQFFVISEWYQTPRLIINEFENDLEISSDGSTIPLLHSPQEIDAQSPGLHIGKYYFIRNPQWEISELLHTHNLVAIVENDYHRPQYLSGVCLVVLTGYHSYHSRSSWASWCRKMEIPLHDMYYDGHIKLEL